MKQSTNKRTAPLGFLLALLVIAISATTVSAIPQIPHQLYGNVTVAGGVVSAGKSVTAKIGGVVYASTVTDAQSRYGYSPTFIVPADDTETPTKEGGVSGETIQLFIDNVLAGTAIYQHGAIQQVNLVVPGSLPSVDTVLASNVTTSSATLNGNLITLGDALAVNVAFEWGTAVGGPFTATSAQAKTSTGTFSGSLTSLNPGTTYYYRAVAVTSDGTSRGSISSFVTGTVGGGGGGGGFGAQLVGIGLSGTSPFMDGNGRALTGGEIKTPDGKLSLTIPVGTAIWNAAGAAQSFLSASAPSTPAAAQPQAVLLVAYELGPSGVTFNPAISLTFGYSEVQLPAGTREADLFVSWWNGTSWVKLTGSVDTVNNTVTAQVGHFSTFGLFAQQPPPTTTLPPTTTASPSSTPPVTTLPSATNTSPTTAPITDLPDTDGAGVNWVVVSVVGGAVILGLLYISLRKRR